MINLQGETVLVAGGAGFVGSQMVRELLALGAKVIVYDNFLHGRKENLNEVRDDIVIIVGDLLDEWKLTNAFMEWKPKYVFDFVGDTYVPTAYSLPKRFFRINVEGTINLLLASKTFDAHRMLYVSSTEVYGEPDSGGPMAEDHRFNPLNTYAVSKLAADRLCFTFFHEHDVPVIIARIFNSYGPRATEPYVIPEIITQLSAGDVVSLGNIEARRDFTYVSDTCQGLIATMCSDIPNGEAVNIGSGQVYSVQGLVATVAGIMDKPNYRIEIDPARLRKLDINVFECDYGKLHQATGWRPTIEMRDGLRMTIDWFNAHGKRWSWEDWTEGAVVYDSSL